MPLIFSTAANTSFTFGGAQHPNVVGDPVLQSGKSIYQWFNTAAFAQPANFTTGNLSRTYTGVRADKLKNIDFSLFKVETTGAHLVAGFARIVDLTPDQYLTRLDGADEVIAAEPSAVEHMNADHLDTMNLYATRLLGANAGAWRCAGVDPDGIDLQDGKAALRLDFPERVATSAALRDMLKRMADLARATEKP